MIDRERWLAANNQYLATMLEWLRGCLEVMAAADNSDAAPGGEASAGRVPAPAPQFDTVAPPPALVQLGQRLGLSEFEHHTLLLCAAMELDTRMGGLCAKAQRDPSRAYPTFALAFALFDQSTWDTLSPERPLRYWRLVEINQPSAQPLIASALKTDERIVNYIKGLNYLDDRLAPLFTPVDRDAPLSPSQARTADALIEWLRPRGNGARLRVIQLLGADSPSKTTMAAHAGAALGLMLYRVTAEMLPTQTADLETFVRLWQRESALLPIALYVDASQTERTNNVHVAAIQRLFARGIGIMLLDVREPWPDLGDSVSLDVAKPTALEQQSAWVTALGPGTQELGRRLAGQFDLDCTRIATVAADARAHAAAERRPLDDLVWDMCVSHARPALDQLAQRLEPKAKWDDLKLPTSEKTLLRQIAEQVRNRALVYDGWGFRARMNRGLGISVMFAGEPGTGKRHGGGSPGQRTSAWRFTASTSPRS